MQESNELAFKLVHPENDESTYKVVVAEINTESEFIPSNNHINVPSHFFPPESQSACFIKNDGGFVLYIDKILFNNIYFCSVCEKCFFGETNDLDGHTKLVHVANKRNSITAKKQKTVVKKRKKKVVKPIMSTLPVQSVREEKKPSDFGNYSLGKILGRGAFGSVFKGLDTTTGDYVAIKAIPLNNKNSLVGVQSEIEMMKHLKNEHIVRYIGSHKTNDFLYIIMEFAEQGSLQSTQNRFGNFSEHLAAQYIQQILLGLKYLHSQSIIHRDIKEANILLINNVAKLSDFGISIDLNQGPISQNDIQCSPYWAAPEVINSESVTDKSDVWSLGITAIEMITGQPPYFDLSPIPAMYKIVQNQETPLPDNITAEFKDFLLNCLNRDIDFRSSVDQLLEHRWIMKNMDEDDSDAVEYIARRSSISAINIKAFKFNPDVITSPVHKSGTSELDKFIESSNSDNLISSDSYEIQQHATGISKAPSILDAFADEDSDSFDFDENFANKSKPEILQPVDVPVVSPRFLDHLDDDDDGIAGIYDGKEDMADIEDFAEADDDDQDFDDVLTGSNSLLKFQMVSPQTSTPKLLTGIPLKPIADDIDDSDDLFEGTPDLSLSFATINNSSPAVLIDPMVQLDDIFDDEDDGISQERERQSQMMKSVISEIDKLPTLCENTKSFQDFEASCKNLIKMFDHEPFIKANLTDYHGVSPIVTILHTRNQTLLEYALPFIIIATSDQTDTQNMLCLLGILPFLFEYTIDPIYSQEIQEMALQVLHNFCTSMKKPLQMFISAGGLLKMSIILENYPHSIRPKLTKLVIEIIDAVFNFHSSTPKSCFARITAQSNLVSLLGKRFVDLPGDDPLMEMLCRIFEVFSTSDTQVKLKMAEKDFIDDIFTKARCKVAHAKMLENEENAEKKAEIEKDFENDFYDIGLEDVEDVEIDSIYYSDDKPLKESQSCSANTSDLDDWNLLIIVKCMNNLAMDKNVSAKLWQTKLVARLIEYLYVGKDIKMNLMQNTCFSAIFHLSRLLSKENLTQIAPLIPMLPNIIMNDQPVKELATMLFLEIINNHSADEEIRTILEKNQGLQTLFFLLERNQHKEQILVSLDIWSSNQCSVIEKALIKDIDKFTKILTDIFKTDTILCQTQVSDKLLTICDRCPSLTKNMAETKIVSGIIDRLNSCDYKDVPELRKSFISLILILLQASRDPHKIALEYDLESLGNKFLNDSSQSVKNLAVQLLQVLASG